MKAEKRQRDQQRKQKISENRKHLANVRVVQKNLVFVVGLPPRLADAEVSVYTAILFDNINLGCTCYKLIFSHIFHGRF